MEGADQGPVVRVRRGVDGLDPRRLRFHDLPVDHGADRQRVQSTADGSGDRLHSDPVDAAGRCHRLGLGRRSGRAQISADDLDPRLFAVQFHRRVFADLLVSAVLPRAARPLYGCRMAGRRVPRDGDLADPLARLYERRLAGLVGSRLSAVEPDLWPLFQIHRLARHAVDRHRTGAGPRLHPLLRQRAGGVARKPPVAAHPSSARCGCRS